MAKQIIWTNRALTKLKEIIDFIQEAKPGYEDKFIDRIYERLEQLIKFPEIGMPSKKKKTVRSIKIYDSHRMYYRKHGKKIIVVYFFDLRQAPDKNLYQ